MTAIATRMIPEITTKLKVGTAACAIAVAAAVPAQVANAERAIPAPIAPVMEVLAEPILGPINFAQQTCLPGTPGCEARVGISTFSALILAAAGIVVLPIIAFAAAVAAFVEILFRVGPYGTGV